MLLYISCNISVAQKTSKVICGTGTMKCYWPTTSTQHQCVVLPYTHEILRCLLLPVMTTHLGSGGLGTERNRWKSPGLAQPSLLWCQRVLKMWLRQQTISDITNYPGKSFCLLYTFVDGKTCRILNFMTYVYIQNGMSSIFEYNWRLYSQGGVAGNDCGFEQSICASRGQATSEQYWANM